MLGDGVIELHNLESGGDEPKLKGCVNQGPTCLKWTTIQKRLGADAHLRLTLDHVWKKPKLFLEPNQTISEEHSHFAWSWRKWRPETRNLLLRKVLLLKVCELIENTFPTIGKVTITFFFCYENTLLRFKARLYACNPLSPNHHWLVLLSSPPGSSLLPSPRSSWSAPVCWVRMLT